MRWTLPVAFTLLGLTGCLEPTQITLAITTDVGGQRLNDTAITVGSAADVETLPAAAVAVDGTALWALGVMQGSLVAANTVLQSKGDDDVFLLNLDAPGGEPRGAVGFGGPGRELATGLAVDAAHNA